MNAASPLGRLSFGQGQLAELTRQLTASETALATSSARLELQPAIKELLEALQSRVMSRSVGSLQALLTAILHDVFPEKGDVVLTVSSLRGAPSLDIYTDNEGKLEDAGTGSGGAVDNVLSAGLRYSALMRTQNRRVMVMDEPDCWMRPDRVPAFISVLRQVSEEVGIQTLLVSHHDESFFVGNASLIKLTRVDGVPRAEPLPGAKAWESDEQPGLRYIRLVGLRAHADTMIPLSPGMNALVGENDMGKSTAFCLALRAVAYGESDDTFLRHGVDEARIEIGVENGKVVEWVRARTGTPKVIYRVLQNGEVLNEGRQEVRGTAPDWVIDVLGIREVDGLDIQLRSQKTPVFLLNDTPSRRAQVLSVGSEASRLSELMEKYRALVRKDSETVSSLGKRVIGLRSSVGVAEPALAAAAAALKELETAQRESDTATARSRRLESISGQVRRLAVGAGVIVPHEVAAPSLPNPDAIAARAQLLRTLQSALAAAIPAPVAAPEAGIDPVKVAARAVELRGLHKALTVVLPAPVEAPVAGADPVRIARTAIKLRSLSAVDQVVVPPEIALPPMGAAASAGALRQHVAELARADAEVEALGRESTSASADLDKLKADLGVCPTCGKDFDHAH